MSFLSKTLGVDERRKCATDLILWYPNLAVPRASFNGPFGEGANARQFESERLQIQYPKTHKPHMLVCSTLNSRPRQGWS